MANINKGVLARMEAKPDKGEEVSEFLKSARPLVDDEPDTLAWFAVQLGPTTFGIFDVFPDEAGQQAHLNGEVADALMAKAPELFVGDPVIEKADVLSNKMP
jgi:quinol monooxygenase YgiN